MKTKQLFRFRVKRFQFICTFWDDSPLLGIKGMNMKPWDMQDIHMDGFYNVEIGMLFISLQVNINY